MWDLFVRHSAPAGGRQLGAAGHGSLLGITALDESGF